MPVSARGNHKETMKTAKTYLGHTKSDWADLIEERYQKDFVRRNPGTGFLNRRIFSIEHTINDVIGQAIVDAEKFFGRITNASIKWHEKQIERENSGKP